MNIDRHLAIQKDTHWVGTLSHILVKAVILFLTKLNTDLSALCHSLCEFAFDQNQYLLTLNSRSPRHVSPRNSISKDSFVFQVGKGISQRDGYATKTVAPLPPTKLLVYDLVFHFNGKIKINSFLQNFFIQKLYRSQQLFHHRITVFQFLFAVMKERL